MTTDTKRQPKGIPVGGQFAATAHSEPNLTLSPDADDAPEFPIGTQVTWADPDGGPQQAGRVTAVFGEVVAVALASGGEAEVYEDELAIDEEATAKHRAALSKLDTPVLWTNPLTGDKVTGRSIGEVDQGHFGIQVPGQGGFTAVPAEQLTVQPEAPRPPVKFIESQRRIRGHNFFAPKAVVSKVPALGATQDVPFEDKKVHLHYFTSAGDWYLTEMDQSTGKAFGFLNPDGRGGHWGYVSIPDLEKVNLGGYRVVERDCHFTQGNLRQVTLHR